MGIRLLAFVLFVATMWGAWWCARLVGNIFGAAPLVLAFVAIFAIGIRMENQRRRRDGIAPYSLAESRELGGPLLVILLVFVVAYALRAFM